MILPLRFDISRYFADDRLTLTVELKLAGGNRQNRSLEVQVHGPAIPRVSFKALKLLDPAAGQVLTRTLPGRRLPSDRRSGDQRQRQRIAPALHVFGLFSQDEVQYDLFADDPFSDVYHD